MTLKQLDPLYKCICGHKVIEHFAWRRDKWGWCDGCYMSHDLVLDNLSYLEDKYEQSQGS